MACPSMQRSVIMMTLKTATPADEVRTELKVADVPTDPLPCRGQRASSVNASENAKVTVNGASFPEHFVQRWRVADCAGGSCG